MRLSLGLIVLFAMNSFAETTSAPAPQRSIQDLLARLGAADFTAREEASAQLGRLGFSALAALKDAVEKTTDSEVRSRAARIARAIVLQPEWEKQWAQIAPDPGAIEVFDRKSAPRMKDALEQLAQIVKKARKAWEENKVVQTLAGSKLADSILLALKQDHPILVSSQKRIETGSYASDMTVQSQMKACLRLLQGIAADLKTLYDSLKPGNAEPLPELPSSVFAP